MNFSQLVDQILAFDLNDFLQKLGIIISNAINYIQNVFSNLNELFSFINTSILQISENIDSNIGVINMFSNAFGAIPNLYVSLFIFSLVSSVIFIMAKGIG